MERYLNMVYAAFDLGNVILDVDFTKFTQQLSYIDLDNSDNSYTLNFLQKQEDLNISIRDCFSYTFKVFKPNIEMLEKTWNESVSLNDSIWKFINNLQDEGVEIAFLSNIGPTHTKYLKEKYPELFNKTIPHLSFEVGARKPSKLFFQSFLLDREEFLGSIYVDDLEENLKAGKKYGFTSFNFSLDKWTNLSQSNQKKELDCLKSYIFNRTII